MQVKKDDVKERILKSAKYEFNKYGFIKASMVRLASRAKMSVGNVYKYFKNKEDLLDAVVGDVYNILPEGLKRLIDEDAGLDEFIDFIYSVFEKYPIEVNILMKKVQGSKPADIKDICVSLAYGQIVKAISDKNYHDKAIGAIAAGAVECISSLLDSKGSKKDLKNQLRILMYFYFHDLSNRFRFASEQRIN